MIDILMTSLHYYGTKEYKEGSNQTILNWIQRYYSWVKDDGDFAWCSIYMNTLAKNLGYEYTDSALARSWLEVGEKVETPHIGDVVIFWRKKKDSKWGHVGLYINETKTHIHVLGGNQSNEVNIKKYAKSRLLGYRRLKKINNEI